MVDGKVTGGVGVSGVTGDQDEQCSKAGLEGTIGNSIPHSYAQAPARL